MNAIEDRIADVLAGHFKVDRDAIDSDVTFVTLKFDSLVLIELGLILDKEFGIAIDDGELSDDMTIKDAADLIAAKGATV
jgi:acyl carrier protein